jgi:hypothetical protein
MGASGVGADPRPQSAAGTSDTPKALSLFTGNACGGAMARSHIPAKHRRPPREV